MTPAIASLLARSEAAGVTLEPRGDRLRWRALGGLPADLAAALREHKVEILRVLDDARTMAAPMPADVRCAIEVLTVADVRPCHRCHGVAWCRDRCGRRVCASCSLDAAGRIRTRDRSRVDTAGIRIAQVGQDAFLGCCAN
jgi:hypothetical protein